MRDVGEMRVRRDAIVVGAREFAARCVFLICRPAFSISDGCEVGIETCEGVARFGDEAAFASDICFELLSARIKLAGTRCGAFGLEVRFSCSILKRATIAAFAASL